MVVFAIDTFVYGFVSDLSDYEKLVTIGDNQPLITENWKKAQSCLIRLKNSLKSRGLVGKLNFDYIQCDNGKIVILGNIRIQSKGYIITQCDNFKDFLRLTKTA